MSSGNVRAYTLVDVLRTINGTASGQTGVSTTTPTTPISLVGEADEPIALAETAFGLSETPGGWNTEVWGLPWN